MIIVFIGVPILLILFCLIPYFTVKPEFMNYERIMFASIGVLTFISIFYSLLISNHWREIIQKWKTYIDKKTEEITDIGLSKIKESKNINVIQSELDKLKKQVKLIDTFKQIFDVEYFLLITVFVFLFSIILVIFDEGNYKIFTYFCFSIGVSLSGAIVIIWRLLNKFSQELDSKKIT